MSDIETIEMSAEDLYDLLDDAKPVERLDWRHGTRDAYVFEKDGKHWMVIIDVHHDDGWQLLDMNRCSRVYPHQVVKTEWRSTPAEVAPPSVGPEKP